MTNTVLNSLLAYIFYEPAAQYFMHALLQDQIKKKPNTWTKVERQKKKFIPWQVVLISPFTIICVLYTRTVSFSCKRLTQSSSLARFRSPKRAKHTKKERKKKKNNRKKKKGITNISNGLIGVVTGWKYFFRTFYINWISFYWLM